MFKNLLFTIIVIGIISSMSAGYKIDKIGIEVIPVIKIIGADLSPYNNFEMNDLLILADNQEIIGLEWLKDKAIKKYNPGNDGNSVDGIEVKVIKPSLGERTVILKAFPAKNEKKFYYSKGKVIDIPPRDNPNELVIGIGGLLYLMVTSKSANCSLDINVGDIFFLQDVLNYYAEHDLSCHLMKINEILDPLMNATSGQNIILEVYKKECLQSEKDYNDKEYKDKSFKNYLTNDFTKCSYQLNVHIP